MNRLVRMACLLAALATLATLASPSAPNAATPAQGLAPPPLRLAAPVERVLPNGLRVVVFQNPRLPIVQVQLHLDAGTASETAGQGGLAVLTAQLIRMGTTSRSAPQFALDLDRMGATFGVNVTRDAVLVGAGFRADQIEPALELVSDAIVNPVFEEETFQSARRQQAVQLGQQVQSSAALADERLAQSVFGQHPYAHSPSGSIETLLQLTRDDVRAFHRDRWRPDRATLAIAGDVTPARAFAVAEEWFARWGGKATAETPRPAALARTGLLLLDLAGNRVAEVRVGAITPGRGDPAFASWTLAVAALESGRLPVSARATLQPGRDAGLFMVSATVLPDSAASITARIQRALRSLAATPPAGAELASARRMVAQAFPLSIETLGQTLSAWQVGVAAGLPADHLARTSARLSTVEGAGDVAAAAKRLAQPLTVLVAGPADRIATPLAALGRVERLSLQRAEATAKAAVPATAQERQRGRELVAAAVKAHGGAAALAAVKSSRLFGELDLTAGGNQLTGQVLFLRIDPSRMAYVTKLFTFENHQILDGDRGWLLAVSDSATLTLADSLQMRSLRSTLESDIVHLLRDASAPGSNVAARGRERISSLSCDLVELATPSGQLVRLAIDGLTHRVVAVDGAPDARASWRDRRLWSDFRPVGGVLMPFIEVRRVDGETISTYRVRDAAVNPPVDLTAFRRPIVKGGQIIGSE